MLQGRLPLRWKASFASEDALPPCRNVSLSKTIGRLDGKKVVIPAEVGGPDGENVVSSAEIGNPDESQTLALDPTVAFETPPA